MRLRNVKNKKEIIDRATFLVRDEESKKGKWNIEFGNSNPIYIEIGMGKGRFIIENAKKYPNINFIGIEKYDSVIARAIEKCESAKDEGDSLENLRFIRMDALKIEEVFYKEVSRIFLNFSDPWPKKRQAKRRLTSEVFLKKYDSIFKEGKEIVQKTDNQNLFEYSLESLSKYGYSFEKVSLDLHNSEVLDNILTEYESRFVEQNKIIYYLVAKK